MALDAQDVEKLMKIFSLVIQGLTEAQNIMANKADQKLRTEDENFDHAEMRNKKARELINAL